MNEDVRVLTARLEQLEQDNAALRWQLLRDCRRYRVRGLLAVCTVVAAILIAPANRVALAQAGNGIAQRVAALESEVAALQASGTTKNSQIAALQASVSALQSTDATQNAQIAALQTALNQEIADRKKGDSDTLIASNSYTDAETVRAKAAEAALDGRLSDVEAKTQYVSVSGTEMFITGANLHIVNGTGATNTTNGLGNLIVGYNATGRSDGDVRTGSHNIIAGDLNNYSSYGGLVVGILNTISGQFACVSGGLLNTASGNYSSVSGGGNNKASGNQSSVSGGLLNTAGGANASVSGGQLNSASAGGSSVSGGLSNAATGSNASVSGGVGNTQSAGVGWSGGAYHTP